MKKQYLIIFLCMFFLNGCSRFNEEIIKKDNIIQSTGTNYYLLEHQEEREEMKETDYNQYLTQQIKGFDEEGLSENLGPVLITFNKSKIPFAQYNSGTYVFSIYSVPIPNSNLDLDKKFFEYEINSVYDLSGNKISLEDNNYISKDDAEFYNYPSDHIFVSNYEIAEKIIPQNIEIGRIEGVLKINLPINTKTNKFTKENIGKKFSYLSGFGIIEQRTGNKIQINNDINQNVIDIKNYSRSFCESEDCRVGEMNIEFLNQKGEKVENLQAENINSIYNYIFDSGFDTISTVVIKNKPGYIVKEMPFNLLPHKQTPTIINQRKNILTKEQLEIVKSFNEIEKMISNGDTEKISNYFIIGNKFIKDMIMSGKQNLNSNDFDKEIEKLIFIYNFKTSFFSMYNGDGLELSNKITNNELLLANTKRDISIFESSSEREIDYPNVNKIATVSIERKIPGERQVRNIPFMKVGTKRYFDISE